MISSISFLSAQPDLIVVESTMQNSMQVQTLNSNDQCYLNEGCVNGLGTRDIIRFTTHIKNIGNQDFYVGAPPGNPSLENEVWEYDECHGHWHYEGYAEYKLYDENNNEIPIGFKNGFCLIDIECDDGGTFTYTCGNQGISAGCGDIYSSGLDCQWIDITDVPDGRYSLVIRVNWDQDPDANGLFEQSYANNSGAVCFDLFREGTDVGIDVIGSGCNPNTNCSDVTLSLTLDNYPQETSWQIRNSGGTTVASGGTYGNQPDGSTITEITCLEDGCYDFIINDTYGDGICCGYGDGSYQLTDPSGVVLASGGAFQSEEITNFCVSEVAPPCTDNDNDGICAEEDCDDNNDMVPAPPGADCNDGDPNTEHDEIGADGCSCAGTPIGEHNDCDDIIITGDDGYIVINGIDLFPHVNIQVFNSSWTLVDNCVDDCGTTYGYGPTAAGTYFVSIKTFNAAWQYECDILVDLVVTDDGTGCTDADGDGVCAAVDCDDSNPDLPALAGAPCNDNDPNTSGDVIQSDGCTCAGEPDDPGNNNGDCNDINITTGAGTIGISGLDFPHMNIQIFTSTWSGYFNCVDNCPDPFLLENVPTGGYIVSVKTFNALWQPECDILVNVSVEEEGEGCTDSDGDGICFSNDCDDNDAFLPAPPGTVCNDLDPNTLNDVIQSDGCTCAGVPIVEGCDLSYSTGDGSILVEGLNTAYVNLKLFNGSWATEFSCTDACTNPQLIDNLPGGTYYLDVQLFDASWQPVCEMQEYVTVNNSSGIVSNSGSEYLFFTAVGEGDRVNLQWTTTADYRNSYFVMERSSDGERFIELGQVASNLLGNIPSTYQRRDERPANGNNIYRVKEVFEDGTFRYSVPRTIEVEKNWNPHNIFPNPSTGYLSINLEQYSGKSARIVFTDNLGRTVYARDYDELQKEALSIDLSQHNAGVYFCFIMIEGRRPIGEKVILTKL